MVAPKEKSWHAKEAWPKKRKKKRANHVLKKDTDDSKEKSHYLKE